MNDIEDLRDAMHATPDFEPGPLDLEAVMVAGGRLRRRRRLAVGAVSGLAVLALLVGGAQVARLESEPGPSTIAAAAPQAGDVLGNVVSTGLREGADEWVLFAVVLADVPDVPFGIVVGRRQPGGALTRDVMSNETAGSPRAEGFHAGQRSTMVGNVTTPTFGYYAGGPSRVTVLADGEPVEARLAVWSEDPSIVLFWFDPAQVRQDTQLSDLTAYDSAGRTLPAGDNKFGVG